MDSTATKQDTKAVGYGTSSSFISLGLVEFERRETGAKDVAIDVLYCGVCHSDLHQVNNDWANTVYPCVPGHEIVGRVTSIGSEVTKFKVGETVAVGCMVDSCRECENCKDGLEQYCEGPVGMTLTYNGPAKPDGTNTYGGYSDKIVVTEHFVLKVPENLDIKAVAPILCAGVTTYSPLRHWKVQAGQKVGIVGLGGLGHLAIKLAAAMGADVTLFSTSSDKEADAKRFGAKDFVLSTDTTAMAQLELKFDFILNTIPEPHDINPYVKLLKRDATLALVGALAPFAKATDNSEVAFHRRNVSGSLIGGIAETREVLDFCSQHNILPEVEIIPMDDINNAFKRMNKGEVHYRYVIDIANTLTPKRA
ncbi:MAG: NAD(P)-dependent alcohol dehydrogenase [Pyrinomonadaceae bacterium]|nr:NAD(P)-dependent alcohol dehydrogenase [Pyrinomonadaceae bacterium]